MKKHSIKLLAAIACVFAMALSAKAQSPWRLGIGVNVGSGLEDPKPFVLGGDLRLQKGLGNSVSAIVTTGYTHFFKKDFVSSVGIIPLKAGVKVFPTQNFYVNLEAGAGFGTNDGFGTSFVYSPAVGVAFQNGWDFSVKYEEFTKYDYTKQVALRVAYGFSL
ncbi:outer membrane beta-barrel protein [Filimonas effusa]|uniref:Outer membrane protein beta-barrel domain-containing protein n=1 Tax=Filimonas effusa TaxID=2508721 RepID=A0A4Q1D110_9BACT|nr:hypothetical protein [Filimonas effusa]RXK80771.1 hypothetical protein ESB13_21655 [Filimonas effusa]